MFNKEKTQYIEDSKFRYTLREMKKNGSVYILLCSLLPTLYDLYDITGVAVVAYGLYDLQHGTVSPVRGT